MHCGDLRVLSDDIPFRVGNEENIGGQGRGALAETLVDLVGELVVKACDSYAITQLVCLHETLLELGPYPLRVKKRSEEEQFSLLPHSSNSSL